MVQWIGCLAVEALIAEATLSPKPGLVTPSSMGAHRDMDYALFVASARALEPCFAACAFAGETSAAASAALLAKLRGIGLDGERSMYKATGGVNTHKGAIFCLGLLSAGLAFVAQHGPAGPAGAATCTWVAELCTGLVERELTPATPPVTPGERLFQQHGVRGARGQAQDGYPLLQSRILPLLRDGLDREGFAQACLDALILSMSLLEDSCLLSRGGPAGLELVRAGAAEVQRCGGAGRESGLQALRQLDATLCERQLSPGGSADMVAAGIFLVLAERRLAGAEAGLPCGQWSA
jgi:triphosphoribosyl-dephospho-CoA synthase